MLNEQRHVVDTIDAFLNGSSAKWDWDDFTSCSLRSAKLDSIRRRAAALDLPLNGEGEAILKALRDEAVILVEDDLKKPKPWSMGGGMALGLVGGALLWWSSFVPGAGLFQNPQLLLLPSAMAILVVSIRNKRKKVGSFDPEIMAQNNRGRV